MKEKFPREAAARPQPITGERLTGSFRGPVEIERYHRYLFARGFCRDSDVLDVASGEGQGAAQLAQVARRVVGVERSGATTCLAAANFRRPNLSFVQGDACALPLADSSVDVVTSFETIERLDRQEDFVAEVRRILRPGGCFIISAPDRAVSDQSGILPRSFQMRGMHRTEFLALLHRRFRYVSLIRQRPMFVSGLIPEEPASISPLIFERLDDEFFSLDTTLPKAPHLIAIASELAPRLAPVSLLVERSDLGTIGLSEREVDFNNPRNAEAIARKAAAAALAVIEAERESARAAVETARRDAEQAVAEARSTAVTLTHTRAALVQANTDLDRVSGSARHFVRQYVPRMWRHLFQ